MACDATKMKDWEIAEAAEADMKTVYQLAEEMNLEKMELFGFLEIMLRKQLKQ